MWLHLSEWPWMHSRLRQIDCGMRCNSHLFVVYAQFVRTILAAMPRPEKLSLFYQDYWFSFRPAWLDARTAKFMMWVARRSCRVDPRRNRLRAILRTLRAKRVVDVGFGLGGFLLSMKAEGAEPFG